MPFSEAVRQLIQLACDEDLADVGDITSKLLPDPERSQTARVVARQAGTICGLALGPLLCEFFGHRLNAPLAFEAAAADGDAVTAGTAVATLRGPMPPS
jgi:nicotinate-nucleotide pyrophosphorylase